MDGLLYGGLFYSVVKNIDLRGRFQELAIVVGDLENYPLALDGYSFDEKH